MIERFSSAVPPEELIAALDRDGCAIVEGALTPPQLAGLNQDLDSFIAARAPGCPDHAEYFADFLGWKTIRIDGLPAKSPTFVEFLENSLLNPLADHYLLPSCAHYLLSTGQLIEIHPGEGEQGLHRDDQVWMHHPKHADRPGSQPELEVEGIFALSDFTAENGATRIVPGSHQWDAQRVPKPEEIEQAEMPAGSAVVFLGSTLHGAGENKTASERRRGMFTGLCLGYLRTEENHFLTTPIEAVRGMPDRVQQLLGYEVHVGCGVANVGSPKAML